MGAILCFRGVPGSLVVPAGVLSGLWICPLSLDSCGANGSSSWLSMLPGMCCLDSKSLVVTYLHVCDSAVSTTVWSSLLVVATGSFWSHVDFHHCSVF